MRVGVNPLPLVNNSAPSVGPSLILLQGYCSGTNPWQGSSAFTGASFFQMERGNLGHNAFGLKVMDHLKTIGSDSYSLIGHSQGGCVSTHIYNYWFTGMDNAKGDRIIQSVGSPYSGCTAAGGFAEFGDLFGIGCGSNNDLSLDGARNWLTGISLDTTKDVFYYCTTYKLDTFFGDWCNLPINLILEWPNDGTCELENCRIPGGNPMGNTEKQCHTSDMAYPAQYSDETRNAQMNAAAAR